MKNKKKLFLACLVAISVFYDAQAQVEISPYLDKNGVSNGINYAATSSTSIGFGWFSYYSAVEACRNLVYNGKADWYLPTWDELSLFLPEATVNGTIPANPTDDQVSWSNCTPPSKAVGYQPALQHPYNDKGCWIAYPGFVAVGAQTYDVGSIYALPLSQVQDARYLQAIRAAGSNYKAGFVFAASPLKLYTPHYDSKMQVSHQFRPFYLVGLYPQVASYFTVQCVR